MLQEKMATAAGRMPTGIPGFDAIIDRGLPRGAVTVVIGGPGTGKTTFGMQVLASGARDADEPGILVAFEESAERILANTAGFSWGGETLTDAGVHFLDAQLSQSVERGGDFDLVGLLAIVADRAERLGARRVVFDGLDVLLGYLGEAAHIRREVYRLRDWVHGSGLGVLVTAKADLGSVTAADFDSLQFMADCVVVLYDKVVQGMALRSLRVAKFRGAAHSANELPLTITSTGIEVAASTETELAHPVFTERVSTGVERLDVMLAGGYYRGTSVLVTGVPGTAKTSLAAAFAHAAAVRGERTLYVSFDEAPEQIMRNVASIGINLAPLVEDGTLRLHSLRASAASPEGQVARIRSLLRDMKPRNLVIDPLSALSQRGCESQAESAALQLLYLAKMAGITVVSTSLLGSLKSPIEQTPLNISTIADTWLHVSYLDQAGERNRALTIIKARGTGHSNQVRELVLDDTGVTLTNVYAVGGEVLMGTQRWEKENEARHARAAAQQEAALRHGKAKLALTETRANIERLSLQRALEEGVLRNLEARAAEEGEDRAAEADELLERRGADSGASDASRGLTAS